MLGLKGKLAAGALLATVGLGTGQMLLAGLVLCAVVFGWRRLVGARFSWLGASLGALGVGALILPEDFQNFASRMTRLMPEDVLLWSMVAGVSLSVPFTFFVARWFRNGLWRTMVAAGAFGLAAVNHLVLVGNYLGIHLFVAWVAATALAAALWGMPLPERGPRVRALALAGTAVLGLWASWGTPSTKATTALMADPGAVFAPYLGRARAVFDPTRAREIDDPWYRDRRRLPAIPPSQPRLVPENPIVILLTVEALRYDVVSDQRYRKELPEFFGLGDASLRFTQARTAAPQTAPSFAGIFSGRYYSQLYWTKRTAKGRARGKYFLPKDKSPRFPSILTRNKVDTSVYLTTGGLRKSFGLGGRFKKEVSLGRNSAPSELAFRAMLKRIEDQPEGPMFLYAHLVEPHAPYDRGGKDGTPFENYRREVALVGKALADFVSELEEKGLWERVVLVLAADHGEAFGEHNSDHHGTTMYEVLLHVPLWVRVPGVEPRSIDTPVSLTDLGPTVLDLFGLPTPATFLGQSLVPFLRGQNPKLTRPRVAESGRWMRAMFFDDGFKVIEDRRRGIVEAYDLLADPGELDNQFEPSDPRMQDRLMQLRSFFAAHALKKPGYKLPYRP